MEKITTNYNINLTKVEKCSILGMSVTMFGFLILITVNFYHFISFILVSFRID